MHFRILVLITLLHVATVAPAILLRHRLLSDPVTKNIEYNSTRSKLESGGPPKWIVRPGIGHSVLFRVVLHEIIFPGNGQDCLSDAYVILTDSNNNSAIYCGSVKNREVRLLSLHLSIQIMSGSEFEANTFANISYEFFDPPEKQIVPVCSGITSDSTFGWYCKPYFYAPNFSETVCIQPAEICDGHNQCPNGEDEEMSVCSVANITSLHIQRLKNGTFFPRGGSASLCISSAQTNCQEGDGESGCVDSLVSNASCPDQTFYCQEEAKCLPLSDVCNGLQECIGLSDESVVACEWRKNHADRLNNITCSDTSTLCPLGYPFFCPSDNTCLAVRAICNGFTDCSDGFDESEIVCKAASHYQEELIDQTARNYSTVPVETTAADLFTTNITLDVLEKTGIRCTKIDFSCPKETAEVGKRNVEELGKGSRNVEAVSASENIHSTTVADVEYREISSNFTYNKPKVDQEKSVVDFSSSTASDTITTSLKEDEILDAKKCTDVLGTNNPSGGSLDTDRFQCADYNGAEEPETNKIKESSDRAITDVPSTEETINKTAGVITDVISSQVIASDSEMNLNPCSLIDKQNTPFNETTNADLTTKKKKLALLPSLESTSSLPTAKQKKKESLTESLLESSNSGLHSFVADLKVKHFNGVFTEPPVESHGKSIGRPHASEVELGESTSVLCNPLCKTNSSEAKNLNKSNDGSVHQRYNFTDGLTLNRAEINAMVMPGSDIKGEIAFPPLWIARISSGPFFLCYGVLLADGSASRWVLIPASCGRYLQPSTMLVHFGAGIDNYEIVARVDQKDLDQDARKGFSLLQLNSSDNIKHFIPQGIALTNLKNDVGTTCKLLAPRHGYIYSFQLQNVAAEDPIECSHRYGIDAAQNTSCFSQSLCLQSGLGGVLTCTNSTLGFYIEGADCYQGQIGWPVLVSVVTADVLKWIWITTGKLKRVCGFARNNGESFPWFTYFNLTTQPGGLCLGVYTQNDTFPLITSVRCLRQCLQSMNSKDEGCVLESVWSDESWTELCAAKNIVQRTLATVSPWRQCLVAYLASPEKKGVLFERVRVSAFKDCVGERFYSPFMVEQGLCIRAVGAELNCSAWGEAGLVQCQRATDGLWEFVGITQACFRASQRRWFMRVMEL